MSQLSAPAFLPSLDLQASAMSLRDLLASTKHVEVICDASDEALPWVAFHAGDMEVVASFTPDGLCLHDERYRSYVSWGTESYNLSRVASWLALLA